MLRKDLIGYVSAPILVAVHSMADLALNRRHVKMH